MGRERLFRNVLVSGLFIMALSQFSCLSSLDIDEGIVQIDFPADDLLLQGRFSQKSCIVSCGQPITVWVILSNENRVSVDVASLPVEITVEKYNVTEKRWALLDENAEGCFNEAGIYATDGVVGFHGFYNIHFLRTEVLKEPFVRVGNVSCVAPIFLLEPGMEVRFSQDVTFFQEGLWRICYHFSKRTFFKTILVEERYQLSNL